MGVFLTSLDTVRWLIKKNGGTSGVGGVGKGGGAGGGGGGKGGGGGGGGPPELLGNIHQFCW